MVFSIYYLRGMFFVSICAARMQKYNGWNSAYVECTVNNMAVHQDDNALKTIKGAKCVRIADANN